MGRSGFRASCVKFRKDGRGHQRGGYCSHVMMWNGTAVVAMNSTNCVAVNFVFISGHESYAEPPGRCCPSCPSFPRGRFRRPFLWSSCSFSDFCRLFCRPPFCSSVPLLVSLFLLFLSSSAGGRALALGGQSIISSLVRSLLVVTGFFCFPTIVDDISPLIFLNVRVVRARGGSSRRRTRF